MSSSPSSGAPPLLRALNTRAVLEAVATGPATRADLALATGLSKPTVAACLAHLVERGVVTDDGAVTGRRGPAAALYRLVPRAVLAVGVDVGHDRLRAALVDGAGEQHGAVDLPVRRTRSALVRQVRDACERLVRQHDVRLLDVQQVVVGVPGAVGPDGGLAFADALPQDGRGLVAALREALPVPASFDNDVNLAALAEHAAQPDVPDFVLVSVGAGIGAGLVIGGRVHRGAAGAAGEIGFLPGRPPVGAPAGSPDPRPRLLEHEVGGEVVATLARQAGFPAGTSARTVFDRARAGDRAALDVVDATAQGIAYAVACLVAVVDPSRVVLGGAVGANDDLLLRPVAEHLARLTTLHVPVVATSAGPQAVLHGALAMAAAQARASAFALYSGTSLPPHQSLAVQES